MSLPIDVIDHPDTEVPASPASTVVLVRDGDGEVEVLMIHRGDATAFGGMWAFPGGVVEQGDVPPGTAPDPLPAARRAAVRETHEEVGLEVDENALVYWSHWLPPPESPRRFSTWFFVAPGLPSHTDGHVELEGAEVLAHEWIAPANVLHRHAAGEVLLAPPTYVTLEQLARYGDVVSLIDAADPFEFATEIAFDAAGARVCLWQGDAGYGRGDADLPGPRRRLVMDDDAGWRYLDHG